MKTNATIIAELRMALRRQGVWGGRAERLMQDWTGHTREDAVRREEEGSAPEAARDAAWRALGSPDMLAATAARELAKASWLGRHPWLAGLALPAFGWLALVIATFYLPGWVVSQFVDAEALVRRRPAALLAWLACWQAVMNWLPWLLSMAWLARIAVRMPGGWKLFWITATVLTVCSTSIWMIVRPGLHDSNSGVLLIYGSGIFGLVSNAFEHLMGYGWQFRSWSDWARYTAPSWIQTVIMVLGILMFHFKVTARSESAGTIQHS